MRLGWKSWRRACESSRRSKSSRSSAQSSKHRRRQNDQTKTLQKTLKKTSYIYIEHIFYLICSSSNTKLQQANLFSCIIAVHLSNKHQSSIKKEPGLEAALTEQRRIIESQSKVLSLAEDKFRRKPTAIFKIHFAGKNVIPVSCKGALIEDLNEHLSAGLPSVWDSMTVLTCTEFALLWKWYIPMHRMYLKYNAVNYAELIRIAR